MRRPATILSAGRGTRQSARGATLVALVVAVAALLGACGIPTSAPKAIPSAQVPFQLISPSPSGGTTTSIPGGVPASIYLFNAQGSLTAYPRVLALHATLADLIDLLLAGPSTGESQQAVTSAVPVGTEILSVSSVTNNVVTVNFSDAFRLAVGAAPVNAVQQVVYTIDKSPLVNASPPVGVLFEVDGRPIEVPLQNGVETSTPVTSADYPITP
jgi:spore germination protein GerM